VLHQLSFGRQLLAWLDPALRYRLSQVIGDLAEDGTVASSIDALRQHVDASHSDS
jgi:hypothetical protein